MIYQEHAHRKLRQAFDAILQQFSSNGNRKSMLSANRNFQPQNSTCSTLLQTMLLYETCIVLSRKCFWDVKKDFWHQRCSLVITTLSARTMASKFRFHIYRPDRLSWIKPRNKHDSRQSRTKWYNLKTKCTVIVMLKTPVNVKLRNLRNWRKCRRTRFVS